MRHLLIVGSILCAIALYGVMTNPENNSKEKEFVTDTAAKGNTRSKSLEGQSSEHNEKHSPPITYELQNSNGGPITFTVVLSGFVDIWCTANRATLRFDRDELPTTEFFCIEDNRTYSYTINQGTFDPLQQRLTMLTIGVPEIMFLDSFEIN